MRYKVSPRVDIAFKKLFGVEENKDLLISLLNSIVGVEDQVADLTILNPYNAKNFRNDKLSILDIKAKGLDGKRFNIEIQISDEADYDKRALYYWAKLYTEQLKASEDYSFLSKAIGIHILNFTSIPETEKYHNVFHIKEKETGLLYFKDLELHTIELKKFITEQEDLSDLLLKIRSSLDMWIAFLTRHDLLKVDMLPKDLDNYNLKKALAVIDVMNFSEEEREAYEDHLKWLRIESNTIKKAEAKGKAEGIVEGRAEGIVEGRAEGKLEEKKAIVRAMLAEGFDLNFISKITEMTFEAINKLKEEKH
jgi:predicted transposase/invertase (TIGR01784 family)